MTLKELLSDWEDPDITQYYLACCLGLIDYDDSFTAFRESKYIFWTGNKIQSMLYDMTESMVENRILEFDEDEIKYRWNQSFKLSHI
jgi:hypothetical protein